MGRINGNNINYDLIDQLLKKKKFLCRKCKKTKSLDNFIKDKSSFYGYKYCCKKCHTSIGLKNRQKLANSSPSNYLKILLRQNLWWAKKRKIKHELTFEQLISVYKSQKGLCKLTNERLTFLLGQGKKINNASIDRIDSSKGYKKNNIRLISNICNRALFKFSDSEIIKFAKLTIMNLK